LLVDLIQKLRIKKTLPRYWIGAVFLKVQFNNYV